MDILTKQELEKLMHKEQQWWISIYLPTHQTGQETKQDVIRLKNLLGEEEFVVVANTFYMKPLLPLFTGDGQFYILALSQNKVRLLNGTQNSVSEVEIGHAIESMAEVTSSDDHQALGVQKWGGFDPGTQQLVCHDQKEAGDEPLLDLLAVQTFFKGGVVNVMAPEDIPGGTDTAAVLRY